MTSDVSFLEFHSTAPVPPRNSTLRTWQQGYVSWLRISDAAVVAVAVFTSLLLRFGPAPEESWTPYVAVSVLIVAGWLACLAIFRSRTPSVLGVGTEEYRRVWTATLTTFGCVAVVSSLLKFDIARGYLAIALPLGLVLLSVNRKLARRYIVRKRRAGQFANRVLAVGSPAAVRSFESGLSRQSDYGYAVVDSRSPDEVRHDLGIARALAASSPGGNRHSALALAVAACRADTVALVSGDLTPDEFRDLSWELERLDVDLVVSPGMADISGPRLTFRTAGGLPIIHVDKPQYRGAKQFQKRAFDVCLATLVLIAASPVLIATAIAIKLESRGPVFYLAERIGLDSKPFQMIKFRSMVHDADTRIAELSALNEGHGVLFKLRQDPRVTRVGKFIRRYSIDELPQFINVLRGEMSVVGPRPPLRREVDQYDGKVRRRLLVRPGITGLWQISGRSDLSWEDSVRLDLSYVENWSMIADLAISVGTVRAVTRGTGAY
ncbi:sugar transferase [Mycolicibacterium gilvum]|uniref:sugar transferase n=1 Tax=Mycolicibacterium gilvum TaxID=1804 RepID=UPI004045963F